MDDTTNPSKTAHFNFLTFLAMISSKPKLTLTDQYKAFVDA
jgi:hypothetical protein